MEVIAKPAFRKDLRKCPDYIQKKTGDVIILLETAESLQNSGLFYQATYNLNIPGKGAVHRTSIRNFK